MRNWIIVAAPLVAPSENQLAAHGFTVRMFEQYPPTQK